MTFRVDVLTIFPELIAGYAGGSTLGRAKAAGVWELRVHDLREGATDPRRSVDDAPFGGGPGMVLAPGPIVATVRGVPDLPRPLVLLSPSGTPFTQRRAGELARTAGFSLLCGRYEGVDQRAIDLVVDEEISLGDFVLSGGELAALCVTEAVVRLLPGALGNATSADEESFSDGLLEYPQFTQPATFEGRAVPDVLRSGDHGRVARWRRARALQRTAARRPDLLADRGDLTDEDRAALAEFPDG